MWRTEHAMAVTRFYPRGDKSSTAGGGALRCCTTDDELLPSRCLKSTSVMSADLVQCGKHLTPRVRDSIII
jgi:hypothetical protein